VFTVSTPYGRRAAIALLVTALLGISGYLVQNKASIAATTTQHEIIQEAAERQRAEDKAGKQLERVQMQNAEFVYPVNTLLQQFAYAFLDLVYYCGLEKYMATSATEFVSPPTQPYVAAYNAGNTEVFKAAAANPFTCTLHPEDLGRLAADPAKRTLWVDLVTHTVLPALRALVPIIRTKVRPLAASPWRVSPKNTHYEIDT
jgi:hypothetical protein